MLEEKLSKLNYWISKSDNIVFFGGAGVSTESGIPDFRSEDGVYSSSYDYPPETIISHSFFMKKTDEFYRFYKDKMVYQDAEPNISHIKLADMERSGKLKGIITQNIDGLHQKAGSTKVYELHGSILRNNCMKCNKFYSLSYIMKREITPKCNCGGTIKPDVVLYEESLDDKVLHKSIDLIKNADILLIGGTSLSVYPAAGLVNYYKGDKMVLINKSVTPYDKSVDLLIKAGLGEVFSAIIA